MVNHLVSLSAVSIIACLAVIEPTKARLLAPCDRPLFDVAVHYYCISHFNLTMETSDYRMKCPWPTSRVPYIILTRCLEKVANLTRCVEPSLRDELFLPLHQAYFSLCTQMQDPALPVLLLLILPCIVTTLLLPTCCMPIATTACR